MIARGTDFPNTFSHAALAYVDAESGEGTVIESLIETGSTLSTVEEYLEGKKHRILVLRLRPARIVDQGRRTMSIGTETFDLVRVHEGGVSCDADDVVTWIAGLREGGSVRVLEMRSPQRLLIDIR